MIEGSEKIEQLEAKQSTPAPSGPARVWTLTAATHALSSSHQGGPKPRQTCQNTNIQPQKGTNLPIVLLQLSSPHQAREHSATNGKESDAHTGPAEQLVQEAMQDGGEVLFLDGIGEVVVSIGRDGLSLQPLHQVRSRHMMRMPLRPVRRC